MYKVNQGGARKKKALKAGTFTGKSLHTPGGVNKLSGNRQSSEKSEFEADDGFVSHNSGNFDYDYPRQVSSDHQDYKRRVEVTSRPSRYRKSTSMSSQANNFSAEHLALVNYLRSAWEQFQEEFEKDIEMGAERVARFPDLIEVENIAQIETNNGFVPFDLDAYHQERLLRSCGLDPEILESVSSKNSSSTSSSQQLSPNHIQHKGYTFGDFGK